MAGSEIAPPIGPLEPVELTGRPAIAQHAKILALIAAELGAADAALFGRPRLGPDGTALGWHGAGDRSLRPLDSLDPAAREAQGARMAAARDRVGALADRLEQRGDAGRVAAHLLRAAVVTPLGVPAVYSDGQNPVLMFWGAARPGQPRPMLTLAPPPPPPPPPLVEPVIADPGLPPPAARPGVNWLWGVPLVLLAGFGYFTWVAVRPLDPVIVDVTPPAAAAPNPLPGLSAEVADLRRTLAEIQRAEGDLAQLCLPLPPAAPPPAPKPADPPRAEAPVPPPAVTPAPPPTVETTLLPEVKPTPAKPPKPTPEPPATTEATPVKPPKPVPVKPQPEPPATAEVTPIKPPKPVPVKPTPEPPATAETTPVKPPKPVPVKPTPPRPEVAIQAEPPASPAPPAACTPTWSPGKQPRVVFVLDGSGSMSDSLGGGGGSRIGAAKGAIGQVVRGLHRDIRAALVSFSACGSTQRSEFYGFEDRPTLLGQVNAVRPQQGTSLAASIKRAGNSASSRAPTTVVVVSDGEDTCGGDPCAEARAARAAKPNLTINVIDLSGGSGGGTLACVASAGGGRVFTPRNAGQMAAQLQRATGQPDASACN